MPITHKATLPLCRPGEPSFLPKLDCCFDVPAEHLVLIFFYFINFFLVLSIISENIWDFLLLFSRRGIKKSAMKFLIVSMMKKCIKFQWNQSNIRIWISWKDLMYIRHFRHSYQSTQNMQRHWSKSLIQPKIWTN